MAKSMASLFGVVVMDGGFGFYRTTGNPLRSSRHDCEDLLAGLFRSGCRHLDNHFVVDVENDAADTGTMDCQKMVSKNVPGGGLYEVLRKQCVLGQVAGTCPTNFTNRENRLFSGAFSEQIPTGTRAELLAF